MVIALSFFVTYLSEIMSVQCYMCIKKQEGSVPKWSIQ